MKMAKKILLAGFLTLGATGIALNGMSDNNKAQLDQHLLSAMDTTVFHSVEDIRLLNIKDQIKEIRKIDPYDTTLAVGYFDKQGKASVDYPEYKTALKDKSFYLEELQELKETKERLAKQDSTLAAQYEKTLQMTHLEFPKEEIKPVKVALQMYNPNDNAPKEEKVEQATILNPKSFVLKTIAALRGQSFENQENTNSNKLK